MRSVYIRCDASSTIGFGHLSRGVALCQAFREDCGVEAALLMQSDPSALEFARTAGVPFLVLPPDAHGSDAEIRRTLRGAGALVLDYRGDLDDTALRDASRDGVLIATIDDPTPRRLLADLAFYPPVPQVDDWSWSGFRGQRYSGWEWVVLRRDLPLARRAGSPHSRRPSVLLSMGGSDPHDFSSIALDALESVRPTIPTTLILGPGNTRRETLRRRAGALGIRCLEAPRNFAGELLASDIAVVSFGVTAYEVAALRIPAFYLCMTKDHERSASVFEDNALGRTIGTYPDIRRETIARQLDAVMADFQDPSSWLHAVPAVVDRDGARRIARRVTADMSARF